MECNFYESVYLQLYYQSIYDESKVEIENYVIARSPRRFGNDKKKVNQYINDFSIQNNKIVLYENKQWKTTSKHKIAYYKSIAENMANGRNLIKVEKQMYCENK